MDARGSWAKRRRTQEREEAAPSRALAFTGRLHAAHRCDRCGAQAYVRVVLRSRKELLFCAHHYRDHAIALATVAAEIHDETERLGLWERSHSQS